MFIIKTEVHKIDVKPEEEDPLIEITIILKIKITMKKRTHSITKRKFQDKLLWVKISLEKKLFRCRRKI